MAGALAPEEWNLVFTSNRGEYTVGIYSPVDEKTIARVAVGIRPNGLAFDPDRGLLLTADVDDPATPGSFTVSIVDVGTRMMIADVAVPGRTRWVLFDAETESFYVNIADPPQILVIDTQDPGRVAPSFAVPVSGPHGLDLDPGTCRLFCACDGKRAVGMDSRSGEVVSEVEICGVADVVFFNKTLRHPYFTIGDPGVIEAFETERMRRREMIGTEEGAHTIVFDPPRNGVYAFLPETHRAAIYREWIDPVTKRRAMK